MKKTQWLLVLLSMLILSCNNDETDLIDSEGTLLCTEEALQNIISGSSNGIWEIQSAQITNQFLEQVEIADLYNVKDDEFQFSLGEEQMLNMSYKRGFAINNLGQDIEGIKSDMNISTIKKELIPNIIDDIVTFTTSNNYSFYYNEDNETIVGVINFNQESRLDIILTRKNASQYITQATSLSNPTELYQFQTGIQRVGFKISQANNALYITNRNDLEINSQLAFKIDLDQEIATGFSFIENDFATKNIEFLDDQIVSIGGNKFEIFNSDFESVISTHSLNSSEKTVVSQGTASLDNNAYIFANNQQSSSDDGGIIDGTSFILNWSLSQPNITTLSRLPFELDEMDGEIIDQKLYMFGGFISNSIIGSDKVYIYDLDSNSLSEITIPVNLYQAFTSVVEHLIYVGGTKSEDIDGDGFFESVPYFGVYNTVTSNFQEIDLMVDNLLDERLLSHLQVIENKAYFITNERVEPIGNGFITRVYSADLN